MRGSVFYLAPLLTRAGWAELPLPGGCRLGPRPIDIHLAGLTAMGAQVCAAAECVVLRRHGVLRGTDFALRLPSVGATLTLMLAAAPGDPRLTRALAQWFDGQPDPLTQALLRG